MSEPRVIACVNCGKRYRIPATFEGKKAKCKGCGAEIDIASSGVPAEQAEPTPLPKKPAKEPAKAPTSAHRAQRQSARSSSTRGSKGRKSRSSSGRRDRHEEEESSAARSSGSHRDRGGRHHARQHGRHHGRHHSRHHDGHEPGEGRETEKSKTPWIVGIAAGVAAIAILGYLWVDSSNREKERLRHEAAVAKAEKEEQQRKAAEEAKRREEAEQARLAAEAAKKEAQAKEALTKEAAAKKPAKPKKREPKKLSPFDARTLDPLAWPDDIDEDVKSEAIALARTAFEDLAFQGMKAADKLKKKGRAGFVAIVNVLRTADYLDSDQSDQAFALNRILEDIVGLNLGYRPRKGSAPVDSQDAYWNAKIVKVWQESFWAKRVKLGDPDAWDEYIEKMRREKKSRR